MGVPSNDAEPLDWHETKPLVEKLKWVGIEQFIRLYDRVKSRRNDSLKWGDEIEYYLIKFDHEKKRVRLSLRATEILQYLMRKDTEGGQDRLWAPEFGEFMIESAPGSPYGGDLACFNDAESNMRRRRLNAKEVLEEDECLMTMPCFPRLGCPDFTAPSITPDPNGPCCKSIFFPDEAICHMFPRYQYSVRNIRQRRGSNVAVNVPIYRDVNTPTPFREDLSDYGDAGERAARAAKTDHVYMDATGFGAGCCCLQVTLQAENMDEARFLYDQLTPVTPILLALSAGTPMHRGYLTDSDTRWNTLNQASDDRTEEERGLRPLIEQKFHIAKSRYGTTDSYLDPTSAPYNNVQLQYDERHLRRLLDAGVDLPLAQHIAHLFIRDPLQVFRESVDKLQENDEDSCDIFDDIQSSNWQNMRFKPPPQNLPSIGWRIECRPMEVQLTDFENAAYVCFVVLLTRVIISSRLSLLIPISKVNENMQRATKRDAVLKEKFYFRRSLGSIEPEEKSSMPISSENRTYQSSEAEDPNSCYTEMTVDEIINGKPPDFPGLLPLIRKYLDSVEIDLEVRRKLEQYLNLIQKRANGKLWTLARFMRQFVQSHPDYKKDSVVSEEVCYDLMKSMHEIAEDRAKCPKLNGVDQSNGCLCYSVNQDSRNGHDRVDG